MSVECGDAVAQQSARATAAPGVADVRLLGVLHLVYSLVKKGTAAPATCSRCTTFTACSIDAAWSSSTRYKNSRKTSRGAGESEAILLAVHKKADLLLMDED
jgi:predicted nucleic acid-binding protein